MCNALWSLQFQQHSGAEGLSGQSGELFSALTWLEAPSRLEFTPTRALRYDNFLCCRVPGRSGEAGPGVGKSMSLPKNAKYMTPPPEVRDKHYGRGLRNLALLTLLFLLAGEGVRWLRAC